MSEQDDYLWSGQGTIDRDEVAALERSLVSLRWRPQPLVLPEPEIVALADVPERRAGARVGSTWWPAAVAGLVAAAAVFALLLWPGSGSGPSDEAPAIEPAAPPHSPDLKDPFGPREPPGFTAPITDGRDPRVAPTPSPDLQDPFAGQAEPPTPTPRPDREPRPRSNHSPDLKNPFGDAQDEPAPEGDLVDPFGAQQDSPPTPGLSPDLKDPFGSR